MKNNLHIFGPQTWFNNNKNCLWVINAHNDVQLSNHHLFDQSHRSHVVQLTRWHFDMSTKKGKTDSCARNSDQILCNDRRHCIDRWLCSWRPWLTLNLRAEPLSIVQLSPTYTNCSCFWKRHLDFLSGSPGSVWNIEGRPFQSSLSGICDQN